MCLYWCINTKRTCKCYMSLYLWCIHSFFHRAWDMPPTLLSSSTVVLRLWCHHWLFSSPLDPHGNYDQEPQVDFSWHNCQNKMKSHEIIAEIKQRSCVIPVFDVVQFYRFHWGPITHNKDLSYHIIISKHMHQILVVYVYISNHWWDTNSF